MASNKADLKKLFYEKKYSLIIDIIENKITDKDKNSGLLNLSGVCKFLSSHSKKMLQSSRNDFRKAYLLEKNTQDALHALKNFINVSMDIFDLEFRSGAHSSEKIFDEIFTYFKENKAYFDKNEGHALSIIKVFKRNLDLNNLINYLKKVIELNDQNLDALCTYIYFNCYKKDWDQKNFLENSKKLNNKLPKYSSEKLVDLSENKNKKINLGFLSADIRSNHCITFFLRTVLTNYDKEKFNIFIYFVNDKEDDTVKEFKKYASTSRNICNLMDVEAINLIRSDKIDIIIDLMGITSNQKLSLIKNRIAKKQVAWCGYNNTTGVEQMDYLISDKYSILKNEVNLYSEKIIYLENIWNCHSGFSEKREYIEPPFKINKYITFGSFNNFRKINDSVINVWSSILKQIPNSKLILAPSATASSSYVLEKFEREGVLGSIILQKFKKNLNEHLNEYKKIDIALDTFPYNGVTTSFEAIWMCVPVLTIKGYNFISRAGESINSNLNLDELISKDEDDYIKKAVSYCNDLDKLANLRRKIFENALKSALFDKKKFSSQFYASLEKINK